MQQQFFRIFRESSRFNFNGMVSGAQARLLTAMTFVLIGMCAPAKAGESATSARPIEDWLSSQRPELSEPRRAGLAYSKLNDLPVKDLKAAPSAVAGRNSWNIRLEDVRLDKALARWALSAGYSFRWDAERYILIAAPSEFEGDFLEAVQQVLETAGVAFSEYPLEACVYANKPPLLRITRLGDQTQECQ